MSVILQGRSEFVLHFTAICRWPKFTALEGIFERKRIESENLVVETRNEKFIDRVVNNV